MSVCLCVVHMLILLCLSLQWAPSRSHWCARKKLKALQNSVLSGGCSVTQSTWRFHSSWRKLVQVCTCLSLYVTLCNRCPTHFHTRTHVIVMLCSCESAAVGNWVLFSSSLRIFVSITSWEGLLTRKYVPVHVVVVPWVECTPVWSSPSCILVQVYQRKCIYTTCVCVCVCVHTCACMRVFVKIMGTIMW